MVLSFLLEAIKIGQVSGSALVVITRVPA